MTSTTEILNDTTSVQSRIDTVLSAEENQLDWADDSGWHPGDPLHRRPWGGYLLGQQTIRPIFQVIPCDIEADYIDTTRWRPRCTACEVSWVGPEVCWSCGSDVPDATLGERPGLFHELEPVNLVPLVDAEGVSRVARGHRARAVSDSAYFVPRVVVGFDGSRAGAEAIVVALDEAQRYWLDEWVDVHAAIFSTLDPMSAPAALPIDGHAYARRRRSRRRT